MNNLENHLETLSWKSYHLGQLFMAQVMKRTLQSLMNDLDESIATLEKQIEGNNE